MLGVNLVYGWFDLGLSAGCEAWGERRLVSTAAEYAHYAAATLGGEGSPTDRGDPRDSSVSPMFANLAGLPPALFTVWAGRCTRLTSG